jgi:hypothetical protein
MTEERLPLEAFIRDLDDTSAAELRVVASRIDDLARGCAGLEGIERLFLPWAVGAGALFAAGLYLFFNPALVPGWITALCMLTLPVVAGAYAWQVQPRTRADNAAQDLNKAHFLPHGGLYFAKGADAACVVRVDWTPPAPEEAPKYKDPRKRENYPGKWWW